MHLKYEKATRIKLDRAIPKSHDHCRLTVFSNAINFLGYKKRFGKTLTPEKLLVFINKERKRKRLAAINPFKTVVPSADLDAALVKLGLGNVKRVRGEKYVNLEFWKKLIENKIIFAVQHQLIYYTPRSFELTLKYIPREILTDAVSEKVFSYQTFIKFYESALSAYKQLDEGHMDIVLDVIDCGDGDCIVFSNSNTKNNKYYVKIPWNLVKNFLLFDWDYPEGTILDEDIIAYTYVRDIKEMPDENEIKALMKDGFLSKGEYVFEYGVMEIFFRKEDEETLNRLLNELN